jgi:hypothetical protein
MVGTDDSTAREPADLGTPLLAVWAPHNHASRPQADAQRRRLICRVQEISKRRDGDFP